MVVGWGAETGADFHQRAPRFDTNLAPVSSQAPPSPNLRCDQSRRVYFWSRNKYGFGFSILFESGSNRSRFANCHGAGAIRTGIRVNPPSNNDDQDRSPSVRLSHRRPCSPRPRKRGTLHGWRPLIPRAPGRYQRTTAKGTPPTVNVAIR